MGDPLPNRVFLIFCKFVQQGLGFRVTIQKRTQPNVFGTLLYSCDIIKSFGPKLAISTLVFFLANMVTLCHFLFLFQNSNSYPFSTYFIPFQYGQDFVIQCLCESCLVAPSLFTTNFYLCKVHFELFVNVLPKL